MALIVVAGGQHRRAPVPSPPPDTDHPRLLLDAAWLTTVRAELDANATYRTRWQTAIDQFEDAASIWNVSTTDAYANAMGALFTLVRTDGDHGLIFDRTRAEYLTKILTAVGSISQDGTSPPAAIGLALIYDCLYNDLSGPERADFQEWIEAGFAGQAYLTSSSQEAYDNGGSDDHFAKVFSALASESFESRIALAYAYTMGIVDTNDAMGAGFGIGREWHEGFPSRIGLPILLKAFRYAGGYTEAETMDHFLVHLRDIWQLTRQAIIPHPSADSQPAAYWITEVFHTADPGSNVHNKRNVGAAMINALAFLPGKVDLDATGMSDQATLADSEDDYFGYLRSEFDVSIATPLRNVLDFKGLGITDSEASPRIWAGLVWLLYNPQERTAVVPATAGIPLVRRWWPGTTDWTHVKSSFSRTVASSIWYRHRKYACSNYEEGTRQNGSWVVHRDGPLLVQRSDTGHSSLCQQHTWGANGTVTFWNSSLYPEFEVFDSNEWDGGNQRDFIGQGRTIEEIIAVGAQMDYGDVTDWHADASVVAITSDLTRSYNSSLVQRGVLPQNEEKISAFTREFVTVRRNADGTTREKVFTYDRITLLDTDYQPRYNLCPASDPDIDGTETPYTPESPTVPVWVGDTFDGEPVLEQWTAVGPTRWDYSGATRLIYDNVTEPDAPTDGNGKVCVTWLAPTSVAVQKMGGVNARRAATPQDSDGTPAIWPNNAWKPEDAWAQTDALSERAYVGLYTVSVSPATVTLDTRFLVACEVMAGADTPGTAATLTSDAGSVAARCGASAAVFSAAAGTHAAGDVDVPSGVTLVTFATLPKNTLMTLTATGGLTITTGGRTSSNDAGSALHGVLVVGVSGAGNLEFS